jgi:hypothetical protein
MTLGQIFRDNDPCDAIVLDWVGVRVINALYAGVFAFNQVGRTVVNRHSPASVIAQMMRDL